VEGKVTLTARKTGHVAYIIECPICRQPIGYVSSPPMPDSVGITLEDVIGEARIHMGKRHRVTDFEVKLP